jgi:hypothetical protein
VAALISAVAYVFTPATAAGPPDQPVEFVLNLRYLLPALAVGAAMTPGALTAFNLSVRTVGTWSAVGMLVVLAASEPIHTIHPSDHPSLPALGFVVIVALFAAWLLLRRWRPSVVAAVGLSALAALVLVFGGYRAEHRYRNRYSTFLPLGQTVSTWAFGLRDQRIGVVGTGVAENQYPLYGPDLSNRVRYLGQREAHGTFATITSCRTFMNTVNEGRVNWLVVTPQIQLFSLAPLPSPEPKWLGRMRNAQLFKQDLQHQIYRVTGPLDPNSCPANS